MVEYLVRWLYIRLRTITLISSCLLFLTCYKKALKRNIIKLVYHVVKSCYSKVLCSLLYRKNS